MIGLLETGTGSWNPIMWLISLLVMVLLASLIRSFGEKKYKKGTEQTMAFFSGNPPPSEPIKASNIYWGFFEAMNRYYAWMRNIHTGIVNDYVYWFILTVVILLIALTAGGL